MRIVEADELEAARLRIERQDRERERNGDPRRGRPVVPVAQCVLRIP
jgi:hypothetical protein